MSILKSRKTAGLVLALVILIATPLGSKRSLNSAARDIENMFYNGVYIEAENYTSGAIADYLQDASKAALGLVTVGANYDSLTEETASLRMAREVLVDLLDFGAISHKYEANQQVIKAWDTLYSALQNTELSDYDKESVEEYASLFEGAQGAIQMNRYNDAVDNFEADVLYRFPAVIIAGFLGVDAPERFSETR